VLQDTSSPIKCNGHHGVIPSLLILASSKLGGVQYGPIKGIYLNLLYESQDRKNWVRSVWTSRACLSKDGLKEIVAYNFSKSLHSKLISMVVVQVVGVYLTLWCNLFKYVRMGVIWSPYYSKNCRLLDLMIVYILLEIFLVELIYIRCSYSCTYSCKWCFCGFILDTCLYVAILWAICFFHMS